MEESKIIELTPGSLMQKLFCTFSPKSELDDTIRKINKEYSILYKKIFVLSSPESDEYMCSYNIDFKETSVVILPNTILLHRKKETNTLYTINALNTLIKKLNNNILDTSYIINWNNYKNCILLTQGNDIKRLNTIIHKVVAI